MIQLDDRFMRPVKRPKIALDTRLIGYKGGFRHGIFTGAAVAFFIFTAFLLLT